jgi:hypothetical protein
MNVLSCNLGYVFCTRKNIFIFALVQYEFCFISGKYGGLSLSAPQKGECGLAVDIHYIPNISTGNQTDAIECTKTVDHRNIPLYQNPTLQPL